MVYFEYIIIATLIVLLFFSIRNKQILLKYLFYCSFASLILLIFLQLTDFLFNFLQPTSIFTTLAILLIFLISLIYLLYYPLKLLWFIFLTDVKKNDFYLLHTYAEDLTKQEKIKICKIYLRYLKKRLIILYILKPLQSATQIFIEIMKFIGIVIAPFYFLFLFLGEKDFKSLILGALLIVSFCEFFKVEKRQDGNGFLFAFLSEFLSENLYDYNFYELESIKEEVKLIKLDIRNIKKNERAITMPEYLNKEIFNK